MEIVGLRGEKVRLVPVDRSLHFDNALRWMNDPEVTRYLNLSTGVTPGMEEEWIQRVQKRDNDFTWAIHDERNRHIGFTGLHGIDWRQRRATSGIVIGDKDAWGQGYATDVLRVRTKFAFETLNLHRVESEALADNRASQQALEKAGYKREGVFRKRIWAEGRWHDTIRYAILDEDYFAAAGAAAQ
ncbi:MAG: GNAT family N-acetyltransferase [Armatimonadetes bacterium]|nr:GNAT family N-acetyltransferase [Armatimonadota bacterium]